MTDEPDRRDRRIEDAPINVRNETGPVRGDISCRKNTASQTYAPCG